MFLLYVRQNDLSKSNSGRDSIKLASTASLNDCQLRNMYRYRYIVVIDFDEVIVPLLHSNLSQMIRHSRQTRSRAAVHSFSFRNTYFFKEFQPDVKQPTYLLMARHQRRIPPSPYGVSIIAAPHDVLHFVFTYLFYFTIQVTCIYRLRWNEDVFIYIHVITYIKSS